MRRSPGPEYAADGGDLPGAQRGGHPDPAGNGVSGDTLIDPDQLRAAAAGLEDTATSFDARIQPFIGTVQGLVQEPGNDMVSPLIWVAHEVVFGVAARCLSSNA